MGKEEIQLPKESQTRREHRIRTGKLEMLIQEAIDGFCDQNNYQVTYNEINTALVNVMKSNLGSETKLFFEEKEKEEEA